MNPSQPPETQNSAYIALGSNLGDRLNTLQRSIEFLGELGTIDAVSTLIETDPVGFMDQPRFLNGAVKLSTTLPPVVLLEALLAIEKRLGRERTVRWGPRKVDLDLLLYGRSVISTERLTLPHPLMHEREFVLQPLAEIAPDAFHPVLCKTIGTLLVELRASTV